MYFTEINGHVIHYQWINSDKDKTFVFINSLGTDMRIWQKVVNELREKGNILLSDKRGHGLSDFVQDTNGMKDYAADILGLLDYLNIDKIIVVGLSVGGMIAQLLTSMIPEKIEKLVLCDTQQKIGNEIFWNERINSIQKNGLSSVSSGAMERWFSKRFRTANSAEVKGYRNMMERTSELGYIKVCEAIRDTDLTEITKNIKIPTLCIVGEEDKSTQVEEVKNLSELIDGSLFRIIENSGHLPCVDNPDQFIRLINNFI